MDFFSYADADIPASKQDKKLNPVLFSTQTDTLQSDLYIITSKILTDRTIQAIYTMIKKIGGDNIKLSILYGFKYKVEESDFKNKKGKFFRVNQIDFTKYIKPFSKVLTFGDALYLMTNGNTDFQHFHFYDDIFNKTYFFNPYVKSDIFPLPEHYDWLSKDNFERKFAQKQIKYCITHKINPVRIPIPNKVMVNDTTEFLLDNMEAKEVAWDTETTGFDYFNNEVICITMSFDGVTGYYLRFKDIDLQLLNKFFENKYQIGNNLKFDCRFLRHRGVTNTKIDFDNWGAGHVLNETRSNSLKTQAWLYTLFGDYELPLDEYKEKYNIKNYADIPEELLFNYATMDAIITFQVYQKQKQQIQDISNMGIYTNRQYTLSNYFYDVMMPATNMFVDIEMKGMNINKQELLKMSSELALDIKQLKEKIYSTLNIPGHISIDSGEQLGKFLESIGWEDFGRSKKGNYNTNGECFERWKLVGRTEADLLQELHSKQTLMKTYVGENDKSGFRKYIKPDSKVHSSFAVMLADSGRCRSRDPNLQNISAHGENAMFVRRMFTPPSEDYCFLSMDYSGLQMRLVAMHLLEDSNLRKVFTELAGDAHSVTAFNIFKASFPELSSLEDFLKVKKDNPYKEYRSKSKGVNFGFLFGRGGYSFAKDTLSVEWELDVCKQYIKDNKLDAKFKRSLDYLKSKKEKFNDKFKADQEEKFCYYKTVAEDLRNKFFQHYFRLAQYNEQTKENAKKLGYTLSRYGAIRRLFELTYTDADSNGSVVANLENISLNSHIQNEESFIILRATIEMYNWLRDNNMKSYFIGLIHDAVELYVHRDEVEVVYAKMKEIYERVYDEYTGIKLDVEFNIADYYKLGHLWDKGISIEEWLEKNKEERKC